MMSTEQQVENVENVLRSSSQMFASADSRRLAASMLEEYKAGDINNSVTVAMALCNTSRIVEAQHFGYNVLQHAAGARWESLGPEQQATLTMIAFGLCDQACSAVMQDESLRVVRNKSCQLVAQIVRSSATGDMPLIRQLLDFAPKSPSHTEASVQIIQYINEDIAVIPDEDLPQRRKRELLSGLAATLPLVLPFLTGALQAHFQAASQAAAQGNPSQARLYQGVVQSALNALTAYAEWAPLGSLNESGAIDALGFLLARPEYRDEALAALRALASRKQGSEERSVFAGALDRVGEALCSLCSALMSDSSVWPGGAAAGGAHADIAKRLADTLATFSSDHLSCISTDERRTLALQQLMAFAEHSDLPLSGLALPAWGLMLRPEGSQKKQQQLPPTPRLPREAILELLRLSVLRMWQLSSTKEDPEDVPPEFDTFGDFKEFLATYKNNVGQLVKWASIYVPVEAMGMAAQAIEDALKQVALTQVATPGVGHEDARYASMDAAANFVQSVMMSISDEQLSSGSPCELAGERALQALLAAPINPTAAPLLLIPLTDAMSALAPILRKRPDGAPAFIDRALGFLRGLPIVPEGRGDVPPPSTSSQEWRDNFLVRQRIAGGLTVAAAAAPAAFLPHLSTIAGAAQELWTTARVRLGERNALYECLVAASRAVSDTATRAQVAQWSLQETHAFLTSAEFAASVASPQGFMAAYMPTAAAPGGGVAVGGAPIRWRSFHELQLLERVVRRLPPSPITDLFVTELPSHVMDAHICWMVPALLQLAKCCHFIYSNDGRLALGPTLSPALEPSPGERAVLMGQCPSSAVAQAANESDREPVASSSVASLRNWLRGAREGVYQAMAALLPTVPRTYLCHEAVALWPGICTDLPGMDSRLIRIFIRHVALPMARSCPAACRPQWIAPLCATLAPLMLAKLTNEWAENMGPGTAGGPRGTESSEAASDEVMRDHVLRETSREYLALVQALSGATQIPGDPCNLGESSVEFLLKSDPPAAMAVLTAAARALSWHDSETSHRALHVARTALGLWTHKRADLAHVQPQVSALFTEPLLQGAITGLTLASNANNQGEVLNLVREVLIKAPPSQNERTRAVLSLIPGMTPELLVDTERIMTEKPSEKDQKGCLKRLLLGAEGGPGLLKPWILAAGARGGVGPTVQLAGPSARTRLKMAALSDVSVPGSPELRLPPLFD